MKVVGDRDRRELPTRAMQLVEHAEAHGWETACQWQHNHHGETFVVVQVGRAATAQERVNFAANGYHGKMWTFRTTWHSRNAAEGKLRMFGKTQGITPQRPQDADYTLNQVTAIIGENPNPDTTTHRWG